MTQDSSPTLFERWTAAWRARDERALGAFYTETAVVKSPIFAKLTGRREIESSYRTLFDAFPDWTMDFDPPIVAADRMALVFIAHATHQGEFMGLPGSGRRFDLEGMMVMRLEGELIADERRVYDFTGLLMKLGVLRGKPAVT